MKYRHAAALALMGWYLVYMTTSGNFTLISAFATAKECAAAALKEQNMASTYFSQHHEYDNIPVSRLSGDALFQALRFGATCVASDDPRLAN